MRFFAAAILLLSAMLLCAAQAQYPRPRRPERFDTPEQVSNYVKDMLQHYSVYGRGRYGKRQMHIADASVIFRKAPFFDYTINEEALFKNLGYN